MCKTLHKKLKLKRKNIKTKKHLKGGGMMGDLGEHVFIGYKSMSENSFHSTDYMPIIIPKKCPIAKNDTSNSFIDYSNGLSTIMMTHGDYSSSTDQNMKQIAMRYTVYLPYLNQLTNISKINIYDIMNRGITLVDEDNSIVNLMISNLGWYEVKNLQNLKDKSKNHHNVKNIIYENIYGNSIYRPLMQNVHYKKFMNQTDPSNASYATYKRQYSMTMVEIETLFTQYPLLKEFIQDLEYRYPAIIEPIILVDETAIYNYANGSELLPTERINRTSRVLEEGMKKI